MTNFIYVTPKRYLLNSDIVNLRAEVSARCQWRQVFGTPVVIDNPNSPVTFYKTAGVIEHKIFEICLVEFDGFCSRVEIIPYNPLDPDQSNVKYELDQPLIDLEPKLNFDDPSQYKLSPEQAYEQIYPFLDSGLTNHSNNKFQPKTVRLIKFDEPSRFRLFVDSAGGVEWTLISGTLDFNPNLTDQIVSYWGGTVNLKANNFTTFQRFTSLRLNTNPQTFLSNLFTPTVYRIDGILNRFYDQNQVSENLVYLLEGNRYGTFEPVGFYEYRVYPEDNKPFFIPFKECLIRPIEYRLSLLNSRDNTTVNISNKKILYQFTVNLVNRLRNNLLSNDAFVGFAGVNYTPNSELILDYLPVLNNTFEFVIEDLENLNLAPSYPQSNCPNVN